MSRPSALRIAIVVLLLAGLLAATYSAGKRGLAEVVAQPARYEMDRWRNGRIAPDRFRFDISHAALMRALELDPVNPNLLEDLGRLYAASVEQGVAVNPYVRDMRQQSKMYFSRAVAYRPTSGRAYGAVAGIKFALGDLDSEFSASLLQAHRRGPWDPQLQLLVIELGLASWQALPDENRQMLGAAIRAQAQWKLANQKPGLTALLSRYGRSDLNCLLDSQPKACGAS
jgi:hypothetical protein